MLQPYAHTHPAARWDSRRAPFLFRSRRRSLKHDCWMDQALMKLGSGLSEEPSSELALYPKRRRERRGENGGMPSNQIITERLDRRKKKKEKKRKRKSCPKFIDRLRNIHIGCPLHPCQLLTAGVTFTRLLTCTIIVGTERVFSYLRLGTSSTRNKVSRPFPIEFTKIQRKQHPQEHELW